MCHQSEIHHLAVKALLHNALDIPNTHVCTYTPILRTQRWCDETRFSELGNRREFV